MSDIETPVPDVVVQIVESYVHSELHDAEKYSNRSPLDELGIWSLHRLAASIYAKGFVAGTRIEAERQRCAGRREREAKK